MKLSAYSQPVWVKQPARFSGIAGLSPGVMALDASLGWLQKNRTREMFFEDFVGFGVMRTLLDLKRQFFFSKTDNTERQLNLPGSSGFGRQIFFNKTDNRPQLNFPAARERLIREVGSIVTDNVSGGVIAFGLASLWNKFGKTPNFSNQFASNETLNLFGSLAKQAPSQEAFLQALATQIDAKQAQPIYQLLAKASQSKASSKLLEDTAVAMAKTINPAKQTLDVVINKTGFALNSLVEDTSAFTGFMRKNAGQGSASWGKQALQILGETTRVNRSRLMIGLGTAMTLTLAVPFLNQYITRKVDKMESYPGELGLRQIKRVSGQENKKGFARYFPYLNDTLKKGNPLPLLRAMTTLPFAFGMVDTTRLSNGNLLGALNLPFGKNAGSFFKRMANMMQFGKGFPFTTQQQMAACFAFLIFSRLITARSDIEYRERMVDSFLGWSVWILATPFFKRKIAQGLSPALLKGAPGKQVLKSRLEIERLLPSALKNKTLGKYILLSAGSLAATLLLMGIVEPLIAIKWTERQSKKS